MASKPLSYECLKSVLKHMDPNKRFQMSNRCPSIRTADKNTMLKINTLELRNGQVTVNGTIYRIGIIIEALFGETHELFERDNQRGGCRCDFDEHGRRTRYSEMLPGDVNIGVRGNQQGPKDDPDELEWMFQKREQRRLDKNYEKSSLELMSTRIRIVRHKDNKERRTEESPSYKTTIQLTVISGDKVHIEHYQHNKNYIEAVKQLGMFLFGGRGNTVYVRNLRVAANLIIRLPIGTKFRVDSLHVSTVSNDVGTSLSALRSIIHIESLPLKRLHVRKLVSADVNDPTLKEAEVLVINFFDQRSNVLSCLENKRVHIPYGDLSLSNVPLSTLIENWMDTKQEKATLYTFTYSDRWDCQEWVKNCAELSEKAKRSCGLTRIPITPSADIGIGYLREVDFESQKMEWMLGVKILSPDG